MYTGQGRPDVPENLVTCISLACFEIRYPKTCWCSNHSTSSYRIMLVYTIIFIEWPHASYTAGSTGKITRYQVLGMSSMIWFTLRSLAIETPTLSVSQDWKFKRDLLASMHGCCLLQRYSGVETKNLMCIQVHSCHWLFPNDYLISLRMVEPGISLIRGSIGQKLSRLGQWLSMIQDWETIVS